MCIKQNTEFSLQLTHQSAMFFPFTEIGQDIGCGGMALFFCQKMGGGAWPVGVSPPKRPFQSFPFPAQIKANVMGIKMMYNL